jgi:hypothetical protein
VASSRGRKSTQPYQGMRCAPPAMRPSCPSREATLFSTDIGGEFSGVPSSVPMLRVLQRLILVSWPERCPRATPLPTPGCLPWQRGHAAHAFWLGRYSNIVVSHTDGWHVCRALNPSPSCVLSFELSGLLPLPRALDRRMLGLRPEGELAGGIFRPHARLVGWTGATGGPIKADAHDGIARDTSPRRPFDTGLPLGTAGLSRLPIDHKGT